MISHTSHRHAAPRRGVARRLAAVVRRHCVGLRRGIAEAIHRGGTW